MFIYFDFLYFIVGKRKHSSPSPPKTDNVDCEQSQPSTSTANKNVEPDTLTKDDNDVGRWVGRASLMSSETRRNLLQHHWKPPANYNFTEDAKHLKRKFVASWLEKYSPWLVYSVHLKGALCVYCVLFPAKNIQGHQDSFVVRPFLKYKNIHEYCSSHSESKWHKQAVEAAKIFVDNVPVDVQIQTAHAITVVENKKLIAQVVNTVLFCSVHDLPLRGKNGDEGVFEDLLKLQISSGNDELRRLASGAKNAQYKSPRIQNEIIEIAGNVMVDLIIQDVKKAKAFSVLADETCDIAGKEQLSIGVRFLDEEKRLIREEFIGFTILEEMDAKSITKAIHGCLLNHGLDPQKCVGQGYDGCSAMSGKEGGVQKLMQEHYSRALYFHCASHRLNLVVNDLNSVPEIRNTTATIKDIIRFFRESALRRKLIPTIPSFCETRWSQKYRAIAVFQKEFVPVVQALMQLAQEGNQATRSSAFQLSCAATRSSFIICACIIAKYSAFLEPIVNILQTKGLQLLQCAERIRSVIDLVRGHRQSTSTIIEELLQQAKEIARNLDAEILVPRVAERQKHRANTPFTTENEYWERTILIPYLDSFLSSLSTRFMERNDVAYGLNILQPSIICSRSLTKEQIKEKCEKIAQFYQLPGNLMSEVEVWKHIWEKKQCSNMENADLLDLIPEATDFFPAIHTALAIAAAMPCTTATVERSFSTLRRVKSWTRSTMTESRLNGLCVLSVHRRIVDEKKENIVSAVVNIFAANPRRLMLQ